MLKSFASFFKSTPKTESAPTIDPELLKRIHENDPSLTAIDLTNKEISDAGVKELCAVLKNNRTITSINLDKNNISAVGAGYISEMLQANQTLMHLNLSHNKIGAVGAKHISEALRVNKALISLNLSTNNICSEGAYDISKALEVNQNLLSIDLNANNIFHFGGLNIAIALHSNQALLVIRLRDNPLHADYRSSDGTLTGSNNFFYQKLVSAFENNRALVNFDYDSNFIESTTYYREMIDSLLSERKNLRDKLIQAIQEGQLSEIETLLNKNSANIFVRDDNGNTLLHQAVIHSQSEIVEYLLSKIKENHPGLGNSRNLAGQTPLALANFCSSELSLLQVNPSIRRF